MIDARSAAHHGKETPDDMGKRRVRALSWVWPEPQKNGCTHAVDNIVAVIGLNFKRFVRWEDGASAPNEPRKPDRRVAA
jgi:Cu2+-containing amine oxidase